MTECKQCGASGHPGPPLLAGELEIAIVSAIEHIEQTEDRDGSLLLFQHSNEYYCWPCHCLVNNVCIACDSQMDYLYRDKRCKSGSYVCKSCLEGPTNHIWKCYKNGCMTIEELAQEEFEMLNDSD